MMLGEKIQSLRKKSGLTQEQLAERLSITRQTISKWELGESEPDIAHLLQLSELFQVTTDHLLKNTPNPPPDVDSERERVPQRNAKLLLGGILAVAGFLGILLFWVLSILHPVVLHMGPADGTRIYTGLPAFLRLWNARGLFWFTVAVGITGFAMVFSETAYIRHIRARVGEIKKRVEQQKTLVSRDESK